MSGEELPAFDAIAGSQAFRVRPPVGSGIAAVEWLRRLQARCAEEGRALIVCELPDEPPHQDGAASLRRAGFHEEGSIADFVRDGVALRLFVWRVAVR